MQRTDSMRTHRIETWLSDSERYGLKRVAEAEGRSMSEVLRRAFMYYASYEYFERQPVDRRW